MGHFSEFNELKCGGDRKLTGANLRAEGKQIWGDDFAATNLAMMCGKYEKLYCSGKCWGRGGASRDFGSWDSSGYKYCPTGMAICGLQTKVEQWRYDKYSDTYDNTGLNRVAFYCCYPNPANRQLDICAQLEVWHTKHWRYGESGAYFYFSEKELSQQIGALWGGTGGTQFEVIQEGSNSWMGQVIVWKHWKGAHGRRVSGASSGQWKAGDTIKFKNC